MGTRTGPFYKTSDEAGFLTWLRLFLLREDGETLYVAQGAPKKWFRHGERIEMTGAATYFGTFGFTITSRVAEGVVEARLEIPAGFTAREIALRVRHPEGRTMARVELDGRAVTTFDAKKEMIRFPASPGTRNVRVYF